MSRTLKTNLGLCLLLCFGLPVGCAPDSADLASPHEGHLLRFELHEGRPTYCLLRGSDTLIGRSSLGLRLADGPLDRDFRILKITRRSHAGSWVQPWGEDSLVEDVYREMVVSLKAGRGKRQRLDLIFRAYDDGVAFRYCLPGDSSPDSPG